MSKKPEKNLSDKVMKGLRKFGNLHSIIRIESGLTMRGIPDTNYAFDCGKRGWIELKCIPKMPKGYTSLTKYTPEQRLWAKRRSKTGENVYFLLQVGNEVFLFKTTDIEHHKAFTEEIFREKCLASWVRTIDFKEFYEKLD